MPRERIVMMATNGVCELWMYGFVCAKCRKENVVFFEDIRFGEFTRNGIIVADYYVECDLCGNSDNIIQNEMITQAVVEKMHGPVHRKISSLFLGYIKKALLVS